MSVSRKVKHQPTITQDSFLVVVNQLIKTHCSGLKAEITMYESFRFIGILITDVKLSKPYKGEQYEYDMTVNVYTIERKDGSREAVVNWQTMGSYSTKYCKSYMLLVGAAIKLAEQLNKIYE